ncbi:MAG: hypothetical protein ACOCY0_01150 [Roseicyclus sp.]
MRMPCHAELASITPARPAGVPGAWAVWLDNARWLAAAAAAAVMIAPFPPFWAPPLTVAVLI